MKSLSILATVLLMSSISSAATLNCTIKVNNAVVAQNQVQTKSKEKVFVASADSIQAFVTEKVDDIFIIEAFIGESEIRIYSEGMLRTPADRLVTSLWSREMMADIECSR